MTVLLEHFHNIDEVVSFLNGKIKNIEKKTDENLTTFEVFLYYNLQKLVKLWSSQKKWTKNLAEKSFKILMENIPFVDKHWQSSFSRHNSATNVKMDPFINVTLDIDGTYLEKQ
ncbi:MAG: hypothetical protein GXP45_07620 [bacterium]|nr:hypothetical protein [bacterium]